MKIGIIGGTGGMGKGFALRWCKKHDILIGSRDTERATTTANEYSAFAKEIYGEINGTISGKDNLSVAKESEVLILSIHYGFGFYKPFMQFFVRIFFLRMTVGYKPQLG